MTMIQLQQLWQSSVSNGDSIAGGWHSSVSNDSLVVYLTQLSSLSRRWPVGSPGVTILPHSSPRLRVDKCFEYQQRFISSGRSSYSDGGLLYKDPQQPFLGPRGPLGTPPFARSTVRNKNLNHL